MSGDDDGDTVDYLTNDDHRVDTDDDREADNDDDDDDDNRGDCLLYTSPSPRDQRGSRMPSSA